MCGYCGSDSSTELNDSHRTKSLLCGSNFYNTNIATIHLGSTIFVKNSSVPMLEVHVEIENDSELIQNNDVLYLMHEDQLKLP